MQILHIKDPVCRCTRTLDRLRMHRDASRVLLKARVYRKRLENFLPKNVDFQSIFFCIK